MGANIIIFKYFSFIIKYNLMKIYFNRWKCNYYIL